MWSDPVNPPHFPLFVYSAYYHGNYQGTGFNGKDHSVGGWEGTLEKKKKTRDWLCGLKMTFIGMFFLLYTCSEHELYKHLKLVGNGGKNINYFYGWISTV